MKKVLVPTTISLAFLTMPLFAGPTAQDIRAGLHETLDPAFIYVWNESTGAIEVAGKEVVSAVADSSSWFMDNRERLAHTVVITVGRTAEQARDLWETYGTELGRTLLVVGDAAIEGAQDIYSYSRKISSDMAIYYERNKDKVREGVETALVKAKPYLDTAVIYVADAAALSGELAVAATLQGAAYYEKNKEKIMDGLEYAYVWSGERLEDISDVAREQWVPAGHEMLARATDYYTAKVGPEAERMAGALTQVASSAADELLRRGSEVAEEYQHVPEGFVLYLADSGGSILKYASDTGAAHLPGILEAAGTITDKATNVAGGSVHRTITDAIEKISEAAVTEKIGTTAGKVADQTKKLVEREASDLSTAAAKAIRDTAASGYEQAAQTTKAAAKTLAEQASEQASRASQATARAAAEQASNAMRSAGESVNKMGSAASSAIGKFFGGKN